jgi:CubicO group peptidase (beta-lactamase class C family)
MTYRLNMKLLIEVLLLSNCLVFAVPTACPLRGRQYPPPVELAGESAFHASAKAVDAILDKTVETSPYDKISFSVGVFSTSDNDKLLYQYHHTTPAIKNSKQGARTVDSNSIFRIGSISKLLTMYLWLINDGDRKFHDPISTYIPALKKYSEESTGFTTSWDEVTIGDLAGQMGGLSRDCKLESV